MRDLNKVMDEIDNKRTMIARAISIAFCDGDLSKAESMYPSFLTRVKNTKFGIIKTNDHRKTTYERKIDAMLDEIGELLKLDVKKEFYGPPVQYAFDPLKSKSAKALDVELEKKLNKVYLSGFKLFIRLSITYEDFVNLYKVYGDNAIKAAKLVRLLQRELMFFDYKKAFSQEKDSFDVKVFVNQFGDVVDEYNLKSMDDLMELYTEICSFLVDESSLSDEQKKIIEKNKNSLYKRIGKNFVDLEDLKYLKKRIEMLYENYSMNKCLKESNLDDIIRRNGLGMDKNVFKNFVSFYGYVHTVDGFNTDLRINGEFVNFTFINDRVFENYPNKDQDAIIVHEFIHSLEPVVDVKPFDVECRYLNEALTEYFAREACKYLKTNIVSEEISSIEGVEYINSYECMLPLVEVLKSSSLWWDIVRCKKVNDYSLVKDRAGVHASKIAKLFQDVYYKNQKGELDCQTRELYVIKMIKLVKEIENEYPKYSKKAPI